MGRADHLRKTSKSSDGLQNPEVAAVVEIPKAVNPSPTPPGGRGSLPISSLELDRGFDLESERAVEALLL